MVEFTLIPFMHGGKKDLPQQIEQVNQSLKEIKNAFLNSINSNIDQQKANKIANQLNAIYANSEYTNEILKEINKTLENPELGIKVQTNLEVSSKALTEAITAFQQAVANYSQYLKEIGADEKGKYKISDLLKNKGLVNETDAKLQSLAQEVIEANIKKISATNALNILRGDALENFIKIVSTVKNEKIQQTVDEEKQKLLKALFDINSESVKIKGTGNVTGADPRDIKYKIQGKEISIHSKQKTDVVISAEFQYIEPREKELGISAKSMGKLRDINLLSNASVLGLIAAWPAMDAEKNVLVNGFTTWQSLYKLNEIKKIFAIQALAGSAISVEGGESASSLIIAFVRSSKKRPFRVLSVQNLLQNELTIQGNKSTFNVDITPKLQLYKTGQVRHNKDFYDKIQSLHITAMLSKEKLRLNVLNKYNK